MNAPCPPFPPTPPFPTNPAIGQTFGSWAWNGANWVLSPIGALVVNIQWIKVSGLYQPSPGLQYAQVECIGGGGGGGVAQGNCVQASPSTPGWVCGGGGGSGGTYVRSVFPASLLVGGVQVTIGAGGAGGSDVHQGTFGGQGGTTTFGALMIAAGGWGGGSNVVDVTSGTVDGLDIPGGLGQGADPALQPGETPPPGHVQVDDVGQFAGFGNAGLNGGTSYYAGGVAGQTIISGGAGGATVYSGTWAEPNQIGGAQNGRPGYWNGVGGGGGASAYTGQPGFGGAGAPGVCVVTEFCMLPGSGSGGGDCIPDCGPEWGPAPWWPGAQPWRR